ncbi:class D sortase [Clostridium sp. Marseille-Q2269]|uniref:class D sortase n=1 Tax=Clostridium sp. Marseille-Q2269 TaxID=2942205 RepID=UPI0020740997|nr:class D sortase [Clostridium sp. Marseille-Q2269]
MNRKYISIFLIIIGISIIGTAFFMKYSAYAKQKKMIDSFEDTIKDLNKEESAKDPNNQNKKKNDNSQKQQAENNVNSISNGAIGIMNIPKIDLKVAIGDGVDKDTLKYAVGHFTNTPYPGEKGNSAIAGHRSYTYSEHFNRLDEIANGDKILIKTKKGEFTYIVYKKEVVLPEEVSVLNNTKHTELTLITCTPIRVATHRLIIKAKLQ